MTILLGVGANEVVIGGQSFVGHFVEHLTCIRKRLAFQIENEKLYGNVGVGSVA